MLDIINMSFYPDLYTPSKEAVNFSLIFTLGLMPKSTNRKKTFVPLGKEVRTAPQETNKNLLTKEYSSAIMSVFISSFGKGSRYDRTDF